MSAADDADDFDLPAVKRDDIATGAAADSADGDERHNGLPRLLRYAMLVNDNANHVEQRLMAEIDQLCPNLPLNATWATALNVDAGLALATELDRRAVTDSGYNRTPSSQDRYRERPTDHLHELRHRSRSGETL
jgi:hypothetical protein